MKKWGLRIGLFLLITLIFGFVFRGKITNALIRSQMTPKGDFAAHTPPAAPNYTIDETWAALPQTKEGADYIPDTLTASDAPADAVVFFIHPTTYTSKLAWNSPLDDEGSKAKIDDLVMPGQASVFNFCCDIYAPRYRQATLWSYWVLDGAGQKALDFAYADVERAFDEFLNRIGERSFILAGHSQGGHHLRTLLINRISGTKLQSRMIAAYPIGIAIDPVSFSQKAPDIKVCTSARQTGCYVTWNSRGAKSKIWADMPGATCVNPLSWEANDTKTNADKNPGTLALSDPVRFETGFTGAQCQNDRLLVGDFQSDMFDELDMSWGRDNYHVLDYGLFYASIRQNAMDRVQAYRAKMDPL